MPDPKWKLLLDVPKAYSILPGFSFARHHGDFSGAHSGTWRCPVTGLVMLEPSFLRREFTKDFRTLAEFRHAVETWQEIQRLIDYYGDEDGTIRGFGGVLSAQAQDALSQKTGGGAISYNEAITVRVRLQQEQASLAKRDVLAWALESNFELGADEGFVIHLHGLGDEFARKKHWFALQWDDIQIHFSQTGQVDVFLHPDRSDLEAGSPNNGDGLIPVDSFSIANSGELLYRAGFFAFIPIPNYGIAVYHSHIPQKGTAQRGNVLQGTTRGHLIPWPTREMADGTVRLFDRSPVRIALNPFHVPEYVLAFQHISYPASGTFTDAAFEPGFAPVAAPSTLTALMADPDFVNVTAELRKGKEDAPWAVGDRQPRVRLTLHTDNTHRTPFVEGYAVKFDAVMQYRNTVAREPDRILHLEFTEDEYGRFEGVAQIAMWGAMNRYIAERGDTTFLLQRSDDDGETWKTEFGGFASFRELEEVYTNHGLHYLCNVALHDDWHRFTEIHMADKYAYDGLTFGQAINNILTGIGEDPIPGNLYPPAFNSKNGFPKSPDNKSWKWTPRIGDAGDKVIRLALFLARAQKTEYRMRKDYDTNIWSVDKRPRDVSEEAKWTLTPFSDEADLSNRVAAYMDRKMKPVPPEGNHILTVGTTEASASDQAAAWSIGQVAAPSSAVWAAPARNEDSINNPASRDFLGRIKQIVYQVESIDDKKKMSALSRRILAAAGHWRFGNAIGIGRYIEALRPNTQIDIRGEFADRTRGVLHPGLWILKRTVVLPQSGIAQMKLTVDSVWESELED